jgi:disulfide bond formation protein DsbB
VIGGVDYGETLYSFGVLGWLSLGTIPIAAMLFLAYLLIVLVVWLVRKRKQAAPGI